MTSSPEKDILDRYELTHVINVSGTMTYLGAVHGRARGR